MTNAKKARAQRRAAPKKKAQQKSSSTLWLAIAAGAFVLLVVAVVLTAGGGSGGVEPASADQVSIDREPGPALSVGEAIPDWSAPSLSEDGRIGWKDYLGAPTVLSVWAPWCPHCQEELPRLDAALQSHPDIQLVTISTMVERADIGSQEFLDSADLAFPVAVDDSELSLMSGLGVGGTPGTYFVNADGTVFDYREGQIGLTEDGSVDPTVLDGILGALEAANVNAGA